MVKSSAIVSLVLCVSSAFAQTVVPWDQSTESRLSPKSGSVESGSILPHFAAGANTWFTEFEIFSLENKPVPFTMEVFDGAGRRQTLRLFDSLGRDLGVANIWEGVAQIGTMRLRTASSGPIQQGYIVFETPDFRDLAVNAIITSVAAGVPQFRTFVPALGRFQDHIRMTFSNTRGFFSGVAYTTEATQNVTLIARRSDGSEICRKTKQVLDSHYEAFLLRDEMPCTNGQEGLLEIISDFVGIVAIGLTFDSALRMWTNLPYEVCCLDF